MRDNSPKPTRTLLTCTQEGCGKKFGKHSKLERHLIDVHGAKLRISPDLLTTRSNQDDASILARDALSAAVAVFDSGSGHCPHCSGKEFRNHSDLAHHLVEKHSQQLLENNQIGNMAEESVQTLANSQISSKKYSAVEESMKKNNNKRTRDEQSDIHQSLNKKPKVENKVVENPTPVVAKTNVIQQNKETKTIPMEPVVKTAKQEEKILPNKPKEKNTINKTNRTTGSSGSKPPITPKRSKANAVFSPKESAKRAAAAGTNASSIKAKPNPVDSMRAARPLASLTLDFSNVGMFAVNPRKSYYRIVDR